MRMHLLCLIDPEKINQVRFDSFVTKTTLKLKSLRNRPFGYGILILGDKSYPWS